MSLVNTSFGSLAYYNVSWAYNGRSQDLRFLQTYGRLIDYVDLFLLLLLFFAGTPTNLHVYFKLRSGENILHIRRDFLRLQKHLNISDLLILLAFTTYRICLLILDQRWTGGDLICKLMNFVNLYSFHLSSNVIVCIALQRLLSMFDRSSRRVCRLMLLCAHGCAVITSMPQLILWGVEKRGGKLMCTTKRVKLLPKSLEKPLYIAHVITVFWLPFLIIIISYSVIYFNVWKRHRKPPTSTGRSLFPFKSQLEEPQSTRYLTVGTPTTLRSVSTTPRRRSAVIVTPTDCNESRTARKGTFKTAAMLVVAYVVCWTPYNIISILLMLAVEQRNQSLGASLALVYRFLESFIVVNSVVNPFLYGLKLRSNPPAAQVWFF